MKNIKERQDFFFKEAKKQGYPARSVFKLKEINKKYRLIKSGNFVLDLGCAPGSWLKYVSQQVGKKGIVIGVDLQDINVELKENMSFLKKDINDLNINDLQGRKVNIIISDLAPKISGIKIVDSSKSLKLNEVAFDIVKKFLNDKGHFLFKIFESKEAHEFIVNLQNNFETIKRYRPEATRKASSEFYVICKNYKTHNR